MLNPYKGRSVEYLGFRGSVLGKSEVQTKFFCRFLSFHHFSTSDLLFLVFCCLKGPNQAHMFEDILTSRCWVIFLWPYTVRLNCCGCARTIDAQNMRESDSIWLDKSYFFVLIR